MHLYEGGNDVASKMRFAAWHAGAPMIMEQLVISRNGQTLCIMQGADASSDSSRWVVFGSAIA